MYTTRYSDCPTHGPYEGDAGEPGVECPTCAADYWAGREVEEAREREQEAVTEAAHEILWERRASFGDLALYRNCAGCDRLVHHSETHEHSRSCAPLRALVGAGVAS